MNNAIAAIDSLLSQPPRRIRHTTWGDAESQHVGFDQTPAERLTTAERDLGVSIPTPLRTLLERWNGLMLYRLVRPGDIPERSPVMLYIFPISHYIGPQKPVTPFDWEGRTLLAFASGADHQFLLNVDESDQRVYINWECSPMFGIIAPSLEEFLLEFLRRDGEAYWTNEETWQPL